MSANFKAKRTAAALRGFLATAHLSCITLATSVTVGIQYDYMLRELIATFKICKQKLRSVERSICYAAALYSLRLTLVS